MSPSPLKLCFVHSSVVNCEELVIKIDLNVVGEYIIL